MTVSIPKELQNFIPGKLAWVATADQNDLPNVAPKGTIEVLDDQTLLFADIFSAKTSAALKQNPKVAVAVVDAAKPEGYQFKGEAELISSGPLFDQVVAGLKEKAPQLPAPASVVKITVKEIYALTPGPEAGKKIA
ncbi:pyridoxamine 5'-phosphate oxidase family protein [Deltaproteobacteria bacterium OttesenSCG-928-M10]|nr:pyridoxamine 5'-phosphate oxidase family protein [Deltaproteobacteria bacterium OttesenSCG-928-M10]